jgi:DNA mismatch repair protein MutL
MNRKVAVLPEHIANKIAAGEVIQRPESVVKELIENSLDAGARSLVVVVKESGKKLIQVTDDGFGMDEADAVASFLRHATSKIGTYEDLEDIRTFGFRGEALASIGAVAQVAMKTRRRQDEAAVVVQVEGGGPARVSREGREPGTTVTVRNLFYNVPARRKFLKSDATEFRHIYDAVLRAAISNTSVEFHFISNDETIFHVLPSSMDRRLVDLFGDRQGEAVIPVEERTDVVGVHGYIGKPAFSQKGKANQYLFLNGRFILSRNINFAVFSAYENLLIKGTYPFFLLFLEIDPRRVDVNVHPSKLEVKFDDEQNIHRFVSAVVRKALASGDFTPAVNIGEEGREPGSVGLRFSGQQHHWPGDAGSPREWTFPPPQAIDQTTGEILSPPPGSVLASDLLRPHTEDARARPEGPAAPQEFLHPETSGEGLIWQLHNKYILSPIQNGLLIVDQHVAHERVLYERAMERFDAELRTTQQLLFPHMIQFSAADYAVVMELIPHFEKLGFDIKSFGKNTIVVEGVPPDVRPGNEARIVEEILGLYKEYQQHSPMAVRDNLAKSFSCRSAVKAGDVLSEVEMRTLIGQLFSTKMPYVCPHGRPIVLRISIEELDRRFGRN